MNTRSIWSGIPMLLFTGVVAAASPIDDKAGPHLTGELNGSKAPYPPSPVIGGITWQWNTYTTAALGSDLWPVTWGPDDHLYTAWGDGGGFGGSDSDGRVSLGFARIEGGPADFLGIN